MKPIHEAEVSFQSGDKQHHIIVYFDPPIRSAIRISHWVEQITTEYEAKLTIHEIQEKTKA